MPPRSGYTNYSKQHILVDPKDKPETFVCPKCKSSAKIKKCPNECRTITCARCTTEFYMGVIGHDHACAPKEIAFDSDFQVFPKQICMECYQNTGKISMSYTNDGNRLQECNICGTIVFKAREKV